MPAKFWLVGTKKKGEDETNINNERQWESEKRAILSNIRRVSYFINSVITCTAIRFPFWHIIHYIPLSLRPHPPSPNSEFILAVHKIARTRQNAETYCWHSHSISHKTKIFARSNLLHRFVEPPNFIEELIIISDMAFSLPSIYYPTGMKWK